MSADHDGNLRLLEALHALTFEDLQWLDAMSGHPKVQATHWQFSHLLGRLAAEEANRRAGIEFRYPDLIFGDLPNADIGQILISALGLCKATVTPAMDNFCRELLEGVILIGYQRLVGPALAELAAG